MEARTHKPSFTIGDGSDDESDADMQCTVSTQTDNHPTAEPTYTRQPDGPPRSIDECSSILSSHVS